MYHKNKKGRPMGKGILGLLFMLMMVSTFVVGIVFTIAKSLFNLGLKPNSRAWRELLDRLRARLQKPPAAQLVPWDREMLPLLSLNRTGMRKPGWFDNISEGVFTSIYQEPVLAYAGQLSGKNSLLLARTSDREFLFHRKDKEIDIWLNEQPFAVLADGALLAAGKGNRLLARLEADPADSQFPLLLGNATAATLANPAKTDSPNPRAFSLLRNLSPEEENAALALAILQLTAA